MSDARRWQDDEIRQILDTYATALLAQPASSDD
jgi:hypothetical protein